MNSYIAKLNRKYHKIKPKSNRKLEQYSIDLTGLYHRYKKIMSYIHQKSIVLMIGDDDLLSLYLSQHDLDIILLEKDKRIINIIKEHKAGVSNYTALEFDVRNLYDEVWPNLTTSCDFFVTSPPYTYEGLKMFAAIGIKFLKIGGYGFIATPFDDDPKAYDVTVELMKFVLANGCIIEEVIPGLTFEEGLPAYQVIIKKLKHTNEVNWLNELKGQLYEYQIFGDDSYNHQELNHTYKTD